MKKGGKIAIGLLALLGIGGGVLYIRKRKKAAELEAESLIEDTSITTVPSAPVLKKINTSSAALNYDSKFTKADKAHVMIMQKMIGVVPDGAWGAKTEAALPKGLARPFSLNELQRTLNAVASTKKWDSASLDEKKKVRLTYAMNALIAARTKNKQEVLRNGVVQMVPDWEYRKKVYNENIATMKANGISEEQVAIEYYNRFKRNLKLDYTYDTFAGVGNPGRSNTSLL